MKHAFVLLALTLVLVLAFGGTAKCGILPIDGPTTGGGDFDGDHPWGGDRTPTDDGVTLDKYSRLSSITGLPLIDVVITRFLQSSFLQTEETTYLKKVSPYRFESSRRTQTGTTARSSATIDTWRRQR